MGELSNESIKTQQRTTGAIDLLAAEEMSRTLESVKSHVVAGKHGLVLRQALLGAAGITPRFSHTASGCRVVDTFGRSLIDWTGSRSSNLLGHRHPVVVEAISNWAAEGTIDDEDFPPSMEGPFCDPRELAFCQKLAGLFQSGSMVALTRAHQESVFAAVELARMTSGRKKVLWPRLHEQRDLIVENQVYRFGQFSSVDEAFLRFPCFDLKELQRFLAKNPDEIGAMVLNPFSYEFPDVDYISQLQKILRHHKILLIVDESDTAFRLTMGGVQEHFGLKPDFTIVGDRLAGQFGFSAVIGREEHLEKTWATLVRRLDRPSGLELSVANASLDFIIDSNLPARLGTVTQQLQEEFDFACQQIGVDCKMVGFANRLSLQFGDERHFSFAQQRRRFSTLATENGIVTFGEFWPNAAHDDFAVDETIRGLESALQSFAKELATKSARADVLRKKYLGKTPTPKEQADIDLMLNQTEVRGRIDTLMMIRKTLVVTGWIVVAGQTVDELVGVLEDGSEHVAELVLRPDLENAFPDLADAANAGFTLKLPVDSIKKPSRFLLVARSNGQAVFRTLLLHDPHEQTAGPYPFGPETIFS